MKITPIVGTGISGATLELSLAELIVLKASLPIILTAEPRSKVNYTEREAAAKSKEKFVKNMEVFIKKITTGVTGLRDAEENLFGSPLAGETGCTIEDMKNESDLNALENQSSEC